MIYLPIRIEKAGFKHTDYIEQFMDCANLGTELVLTVYIHICICVYVYELEGCILSTYIGVQSVEQLPIAHLPMTIDPRTTRFFGARNGNRAGGTFGWRFDIFTSVNDIRGFG